MRQANLAFLLGCKFPSRVEGYWLGEDWPNLLSLKAPEVLTYELRGRIVASLCAGLSVIWPTEVAQNHVPSL